MAHMVAKVSLNIDKPPQAVWDYLATPANQPKWMSGVEQVTADGKISKGKRYSVKYRYNKKLNDITFEGIEAEPPRRLSVKTVAGPYPIQGTYDLVADSAGTRLIYTQDAPPDHLVTSIIFTLFGWALKPMVRKTLLKDHMKLKALIEGGD